ncbi:MAG: hypothetical protein Q9222_003786 [Ikaeria aurantiellina]
MLQEVLVSPTAKLDISKLLKSSASPSPPPPPITSLPPFSRSFSIPGAEADPRSDTSAATSPASQYAASTFSSGSLNPSRFSTAGIHSTAPASAPSGKRTASTSPEESRHASKKPTRQWSKDDSDLLVTLRLQNMKWEDISQRFPGRTPTACRLRYQNYLERRFDWTDEKKQKLARLYERHKQKMWEPIAQELVIPWRTVEDMHWLLGQDHMATLGGSKLLHKDRNTGDPSLGGTRTQSTLSSLGGLPTPASGFMGAPSSTFPQAYGQPPPPTTNGAGALGFGPGGEGATFGFHRRNRRQSSSSTQLPSLAEMERGIPAYAAQRAGRYRRGGEDEGEEEHDDDDDEDEDEDEGEIKRE